MYTKNLLFVFALLISAQVFGQSKKTSGALGGFLQTPFMTEYMKLKVEAETAVASVQSQGHNPQDIRKLRAEYDKIANQFNAVLGGIKSDFQNPKKLKYISKFPDSYSDGLQLKLYKLSDAYAQGFQQSLADVTSNEVDGGAILFLITEVIGLTKGLSDYLGKVKREKRKFNTAYLNKHLYTPHRWRTWDEIRTGVSPNANMNNNGMDPEFDSSQVPLNIRNGNNFNNYNNNSNYGNDFNNNYNSEYNEFGSENNFNESGNESGNEYDPNNGDFNNEYQNNSGNYEQGGNTQNNNNPNNQMNYDQYNNDQQQENNMGNNYNPGSPVDTTQNGSGNEEDIWSYPNPNTQRQRVQPKSSSNRSQSKNNRPRRQ